MKHALSSILSSVGAALLFAACGGGSSADSGTHMDAAADAGGGPSADAAGGDTGSSMVDSGGDLGTLVVPGDNGIAAPVHLTPDLSILFYVQANRLQSIALAGGSLPADMGPAPGFYTESSAFNVFYLYYDLPATSMVPFQGTLRAIDGSKTSTPTQLARHATILSISTDWNRALIAENIQGGMTAGSTATADLAGVGLTMAPLKFASGVPIGRWDPIRRVYFGSCSPAGAFTSSITLMVAACVPTSSTTTTATERSLLSVNLATGTTQIVASNVSAAVVVGVDRSYVLYLDANRQLHGVDRGGGHPTALADTSQVDSIFPLAGKRFAYTTVSRALSVASWPSLIPTMLLASGAERIERRAPNGAHVMFRKSPLAAGLRDLEIIATSTRANPTPVPIESMVDGVPGDVAFTSDSKFALWYGAVTYDGTVPVGNAMSIGVTGTGQANLLAPNASYIGTYANAMNVFIMANTHHDTDANGNDRLAADLSVRKSDGSTELQVLAQSVDARFFRIRKNTIVYRLPPGPSAGLWMRMLP
jgi:hypothetical protein